MLYGPKSGWHKEGKRIIQHGNENELHISVVKLKPLLHQKINKVCLLYYFQEKGKLLLIFIQISQDINELLPKSF